MNPSGNKRLFFGLEVKAPWPERFPPGRLLEENNRHLTLAFLGLVSENDFARLKQSILSEFLLPRLKVGLVGKFDQCLFLPFSHPHVVAWHLQWLEEPTNLLLYQKQLLEWLEAKGFHPDRRHDFNAHVTLARNPSHLSEWTKSFRPLPCMISALHLFESLGNSHYLSLFSFPFLLPFEAIEHTGDVAFLVRGKNAQELYTHAKIALSFLFPPLLSFLGENLAIDSLEATIVALNQIITIADTEIGCPFKAVSFHSDLVQKDNFLEWEMIIDV